MTTMTDATRTEAAAPTTRGGEPRWFIHSLVRVLVDGDETGGRSALTEVIGAPGDMPPLHVHHRDDETFIVLEGTVRVWIGDREAVAGPGETVFAPRGVPHAYRVEPAAPARIYVASVPAGFERFVLEASVPAAAPGLPPADIEVDPAQLAEIAGRYGIEILGPPGMLP
jgi:quercetin dioxygenase-like cupin family protein